VKAGAGYTPYYYHADGLGSITGLSDATGTMVQTYGYDAFGNVTPTGGITKPFTFTGREYDAETSMYFYRARYYDPVMGRFVTKDPIGFAGGVNLYAYVQNNPINRIDPTGLSSNDMSCKKDCNHSWADCYTNCLNTLVPFDALKSFIYSNMIANAGYFLGGGQITFTVGGKSVLVYASPFVLRGAAGTIAAATGDVGLYASAGITAWVAGVSYGCMISCSIDKCSYK